MPLQNYLFKLLTSAMSKALPLTETYVREIIQSEIFQILSQIKVEIQTKIKAIDRNIIDLRSQVKLALVHLQNSTSSGTNTNFKQLLDRMDKIQAEMQSLRYYQMSSMKDSRTRSLEKERKPIFKKSSTATDLSHLILGLENDINLGANSSNQGRFSNSKSNTNYNTINQGRFSSSAENFSKPPLPTRTLKQAQEESDRLQRKSSSSSTQKRRNPILDSSSQSTLKKWLHDNEEGRNSCFGAVIRQQDIQQSVFL